MSCVLVGCNQEDIGKILGRPQIPASCIANGDGTCFRNGQRIPTTNMECMESRNVSDIESYLLDIELDLYKCKKNPKRCPRL